MYNVDVINDSSDLIYNAHLGKCWHVICYKKENHVNESLWRLRK